MTPLRLTADQVAAHLQISRSQVFVLVSRGDLVARRDPGGRRFWFLPEDVRDYVVGMPAVAALGVKGGSDRVYENRPVPDFPRRTKRSA